MGGSCVNSVPSALHTRLHTHIHTTHSWRAPTHIVCSASARAHTHAHTHTRVQCATCSWDSAPLTLVSITQAVFTLLLGPFTFFDVQKTKYLQILTSLMRWIGESESLPSSPAGSSVLPELPTWAHSQARTPRGLPWTPEGTGEAGLWVFLRVRKFSTE